MNENKNPFDILVRFVQYVMDVIARAMTAFLDGLNDAVEHSSSPLFGVVATFLPFALPLPIAFMTAASAQKFFNFMPLWASILGVGIEGIGLLVWVWLVESIISEDRTLRDAKRFLGGMAIAYELVLVFLNVILAWNDGASFLYGIGLLLLCSLPAMSAAMYGFQRRQARISIANKEAERKAEAERLRQERREDRKQAQAMKLQYASDAKQEKLNSKSFRKS
jgi:hypothetical protein